VSWLNPVCDPVCVRRSADFRGAGLDLDWLWASVVSALASFTGIPVSTSLACPELVEFHSWSSSSESQLQVKTRQNVVCHLSRLGFCDWSTGFLRRDSCVPSQQRVLNSSSVVGAVVFVNQNLSTCGPSLLGSTLANRWLNVVCLLLKSWLRYS
jgi:hypothetical protein